MVWVGLLCVRKAADVCVCIGATGALSVSIATQSGAYQLVTNRKRMQSAAVCPALSNTGTATAGELCPAASCYNVSLLGFGEEHAVMLQLSGLPCGLQLQFEYAARI